MSRIVDCTFCHFQARAELESEPDISPTAHWIMTLPAALNALSDPRILLDPFREKRIFDPFPRGSVV
jgi:hypothetical protein